MSSITPENFFEQLKKIIDLPDNIIQIDISVKIDSYPEITIKKYLEETKHSDGYMDTITERFELKRIE